MTIVNLILFSFQQYTPTSKDGVLPRLPIVLSCLLSIYLHVSRNLDLVTFVIMKRYHSTKGRKYNASIPIHSLVRCRPFILLVSHTRLQTGPLAHVLGRIFSRSKNQSLPPIFALMNPLSHMIKEKTAIVHASLLNAPFPLCAIALFAPTRFRNLLRRTTQNINKGVPLNPTTAKQLRR